MERILEHSRSTRLYSWVDIADVGGGAAKLYLLNDSCRPPTPLVGDFAYDFKSSTLQVFQENIWKTVTIQDVRSRLWHPSDNRSILCFTDSGLPFWMPGSPDDEDEDDACDFRTVEDVLERFKDRIDPEKIQVCECPKRRRDAEAGTQGQTDGDGFEKRKSRRLAAGPSESHSSPKSSTRFVRSSVGFPENSPKIRWEAGFETYLPFCGKETSLDVESMIVQELASRPSVESSGSEACGSGPDAFRVRELVVQLELDASLRNPERYDARTVSEKWNDLVVQIRTHMSQSTSVVIRGWTPHLRLNFDKASMALQFGDLGFRCLWLDASILASNRDVVEKDRLPYHKTTSMAEFIDLVEDPTVCGNFLDGKDMNQSPPMWAKPVLDSTTAWEHTAHLRFLKRPDTKSKKYPLQLEEASPTVIRSETWTSQGWRLVTHPGSLTRPHHDCCGMGTYVVGNSGAKVWSVMRPKREVCPSSLKDLEEALKKARDLSDEGEYSEADIATVCLEEGDVMFQPPGVLHCVYTPVPSIFSGGYFYSYHTMHLTRAVLSMGRTDTTTKAETLTNDHRRGYLRTLCRMVIALRYRSEARKIGKRSLISLLLIILDSRTPESITCRMRDPLAEEERGELCFATECAKRLLRWMNLTQQQARTFVSDQGAYYLAGDEIVEIPPLVNGVPDPIFPPMSGTV